MSGSGSGKSVITCDLEGRIETFNEDAVAIFGWSREEVVGKKRVSLFSPGEVVLEHVPRWLKTSVEQGAFETDTVFVKKSGEKFPAHVKITPTKKNGAHVGYCGVTEPLPASELARATPKISFATRAFRWLVITRAPFLTATLVPVLAAAALAGHRMSSSSPVDARFWALFALVVVGACALHVAANVFNDVFDWQSGADQGNNDYFLPFSGGSRAIELGLISERSLAVVAWTALVVAASCGALLAYLSGLAVLAFGVIGAFAAYFYTAPPLRLAARRGLGELLVALCFGPLMTAGAFVALGRALPGIGGVGGVDVWALVSSPAVLIGVPLGLLTAAILWANEIPDAKSDAAAGKNHLVVTLGKRGAQLGYVALVAGAFAVLGALVVTGVLPRACLAGFLGLPLGLRAIAVLFRHYEDRQLIVANKSTIQMHVVTGLGVAVGLVLDQVLA